ncbi:MAG: MerR family transcriptional regulator [Clostridia bacterium]|nr:MerR family transcriptional regulator [Clostridia bacterium]
MRLSVSELSEQSGVSVRTLHYYDEIGLLKPPEVTEAGYRYYDDNAVRLLQQILFFRELDFSLKDIGKILNAPNYDKDEALRRQRELLSLKRERLDNLVRLLDATLKGEKTMEFKEFDTTKIDALRDQYAAEAKDKYGDTDAWTQSQQRAKKYSKADWDRINAEADAIMEGFGKLVGKGAEDEAVRAQVESWKAHLEHYYYDCTDEIFSGLAQMYVQDERFTQNIDKHGKGTAQLMHDSILAYVHR